MSKKKIGFIGTGVMGKGIISHLLADGHLVYVFNRTKEKTLPLIDKGAVWGGSPSSMAKECSVIFTMVGFPTDVEEVYLGPRGLLENGQSGSVFVDLTTSTPTLAKEIAEKAALKNITVLDAPVSGGDIGAKNGTLSIMIGGDEKAFQTILPIFQLFGQNIVYHGPAGLGQHVKMSNQIVIASTMIGVCESLVYAKEAGLDLDRVLKSISNGAAGSWSLSNLAPRMIKEDYDPGFYVRHFIKDLKIALTEAERMDMTLPGLALAHSLYEDIALQGHDKNGTQALITHW
ncbi:NAD(P)-dependent oxidoreductase [Jeotgalibacillus marinus]|uniref:NAD(P)-dependent oxidoreductase n=1 Tax=Jeotgalibacillus marinus TaxID=86667 RepID=A0ABV3Q723_9BACL